jgi:outer membrane protein OmpA-like peptidoglycan-associated protein
LAAEITAILETHHVTDTAVEATNEGVRITLSNIQFAADSAVLPAAEQAKLQEIAGILNSLPARNILVAGHTASTGNRSGELRISQARAQSVADYLISLGVRRPGEITVTGYGAAYPVASNATPAGMAANRRVEITILED